MALWFSEVRQMVGLSLIFEQITSSKSLQILSAIDCLATWALISGSSQVLQVFWQVVFQFSRHFGVGFSGVTRAASQSGQPSS